MSKRACDNYWFNVEVQRGVSRVSDLKAEYESAPDDIVCSGCGTMSQWRCSVGAYKCPQCGKIE